MQNTLIRFDLYPRAETQSPEYINLYYDYYSVIKYVLTRLHTVLQFLPIVLQRS